jgi:hypothetical protein
MMLAQKNNLRNEGTTDDEALRNCRNTLHAEVCCRRKGSSVHRVQISFHTQVKGSCNEVAQILVNEIMPKGVEQVRIFNADNHCRTRKPCKQLRLCQNQKQNGRKASPEKLMGERLKALHGEWLAMGTEMKYASAH